MKMPINYQCRDYSKTFRRIHYKKTHDTITWKTSLQVKINLKKSYVIRFIIYIYRVRVRAIDLELAECRRNNTIYNLGRWYAKESLWFKGQILPNFTSFEDTYWWKKRRNISDSLHTHWHRRFFDGCLIWLLFGLKLKHTITRNTEQDTTYNRQNKNTTC